MVLVGEVRVWWAKLGYLNYMGKCNVFSIIPLHIFFTFLVSKLPKGITKTLHKNFNFKPYFHKFLRGKHRKVGEIRGVYAMYLIVEIGPVSKLRNSKTADPFFLCLKLVMRSFI